MTTPINVHPTVAMSAAGHLAADSTHGHELMGMLEPPIPPEAVS